MRKSGSDGLMVAGMAAWMWVSNLSLREDPEVDRSGSGEMTEKGQLTDALAGVVGWSGEVQDLALWRGLVAVVVGFALRVVQGFFARKRGEAASLRTILAHVQVAKEDWENQILEDGDEEGGKRRLDGVESEIAHLREIRLRDEGRERYTQFVPVSVREEFAVEEVREYLGFLDRRTIRRVVRFLRRDAMAQACANDFRSDYVRKQPVQERRVELLRGYRDEAARAFKSAENALDALAPYARCPTLVWYIPWGRFVWASLYRRSGGSRTDVGRKFAWERKCSKAQPLKARCSCSWTGLGCVAGEDRFFRTGRQGYDRRSDG